MKGFNSLREMRKALRKVDSGVAGDTIFIAQSMVFVAKKLDEIARILRALNLSDYQYFMAYKLKFEGLSFEEALKQWHEHVKGGSKR